LRGDYDFGTAPERESSFWRKLLRAPFQSKIRSWLFLFLLIASLFRLYGGMNPDSRFATLSAMVEDRSFRIDPYKKWTVDFAETPDGRIYSNKAPGPMLIGFPIFAPLDAWITRGIGDRAIRDEKRFDARQGTLWFLSLVFQMIPFVFLTAYLIGRLEKRGVSRSALNIAALAILFGNTAALLMSTYFGHGISAVLMMALVVACLEQASFAVGLGFGLLLLCDFSAAMIALPLAATCFVFWPRPLSAQRLSRVAAGALAPAVLWCFYHIACFGNPLVIAPTFMNQALMPETGGRVMSGLLSALPNPENVLQIFFGMSRGLLWTQGWVLVVLVSLLPALRWLKARSDFAHREALAVSLLAVTSLATLVWMSASYISYDGGMNPGPRYLCPVLPLFGLLLGMLYDGLSRPLRALAWVGVAMSCALFCCVYGSTPLAAEIPVPIWSFYLGKVKTDHMIWQVSVIFAAGCGYALVRTRLFGGPPARAAAHLEPRSAATQLTRKAG
jgi:hypothetical protein